MSERNEAVLREIMKTLRDILHELRWRFRDDKAPKRPVMGDD